MVKLGLWDLGGKLPFLTHSSILAWRIPWIEEPDRLESMRSQRVGTIEIIYHTHNGTNLVEVDFATLFLLLFPSFSNKKAMPTF